VLRDEALRPASAVAVMATFRPALLLLERALTLLGVVLLGWYGLEQLQIAYDQAAAGYELEEVRMHVAAANPASPVPHLTLATGTVVGRVEIPRVGVSALVREGDDVKTLRRAVGHIPGTALSGTPRWPAIEIRSSAVSGTCGPATTSCSPRQAGTPGTSSRACTSSIRRKCRCSRRLRSPR
jgi:hypothetical protein